MALTAVQRPLSGSTNGSPINVSSTGGGTNTVIHTHPSATASGLVYDKIWAYATNSSTQNVTITLEFGDSANHVLDEIPPQAGMYPILTGQILFGVSSSGNSAVLRVFASTSAIIDIYGHVDRVTEI